MDYTQINTVVAFRKCRNPVQVAATVRLMTGRHQSLQSGRTQPHRINPEYFRTCKYPLLYLVITNYQVE